MNHAFSILLECFKNFMLQRNKIICVWKRVEFLGRNHRKNKSRELNADSVIEMKNISFSSDILRLEGGGWPLSTSVNSSLSIFGDPSR